ncbi:hypothetical protein CAA66_001469, partial [Neisseria gonorrhoeae]
PSSLAACAAEGKRREEKRREEKRREEKRREEKRRFFAGWIHFRLLIRFNRLKKKIFTDGSKADYIGFRAVFQHNMADEQKPVRVAPPRLKGNGSLRRPSTGRIGSVPFVLPAARRLVLIFVNPL